MPEPSLELVSGKLSVVGKFAEVTGEQLMGQVFRQAKQTIKDNIKELSADIKSTYGEEFFGTFRDNSQRFAKLVRDVTYNAPVLEKMNKELYAVDDIMAVAMKYQDEASDVY